MASRIQGITIEINGNAEPLKNTLKGVDGVISRTGKELKDVNKLLKFDTKNPELLAQKQTALNEKYNATNARLQILKEAQRQWKAEAEKGTEGAQKQYEALTREIAATQNELNKLTMQMKLFSVVGKIAGGVGDVFKSIGGVLSKTGETITKFGSGMSDIGRKLAPISAILTTLGKKSIDYAKTLDQAYDQVISKTGATGQAAEEYRNIVSKVFSDTEFDAQQVADAIGNIGVRFKGLSSGELENVSNDFLKFAKITGTDVATAVEKTSRVMAANNIETKDYKRLLDQLVFTQQQTGIQSETLLGSLDKYGAAFRNAGFGVGESIALLGQFEAKGVDVNKALMALQTGGGRALKELGNAKAKILPLFDMLSKGELTTKEVQQAMETLGVRGGGALIDAFTNCGLSYKDFAAVIESTDVAGTLDNTYNETYNSTEKLKKEFDRLKEKFGELGVKIMESGLLEGLEKLVDAFGRLIDKFNEMPEDKQKMIIQTLTAIAVAAPVLMTVGGIISSVGSIISMVGSALSSIGGAIASITPVGLVIMALAGTFIYLWERVTGFKDTVVNNFNDVKKSASELFSGIKERIEPLKEALGNLISLLEGQFSPVIGIVTAVWTTALNWLSTAFDTFCNAILGLLDIFIGIFTGDWDRVWSGIKTIFTGAIDGLIGVFSGLIDGIMKGFLAFYEGIRKAAAVVGIELPEITHTVESGMGDMVASVKTAGNDMTASAQTAGNDMAAGYQSAENFNTSGIENKFQTVNNNAYTWGKDAGNQWASGLENSRINSAVTNVAQQIKDKIGFSVPEEGPLSNADTYMPDMIDLFVKGIKDNQSKLFNAVNSLASGMRGNFDTMQGVMATAGGASGYTLPPMNIYIGNKEIKDYAVSASNEYVNDTAKAQNFNWGRL